MAPLTVFHSYFSHLVTVEIKEETFAFLRIVVSLSVQVWALKIRATAKKRNMKATVGYWPYLEITSELHKSKIFVLGTHITQHETSEYEVNEFIPYWYPP